MPTKEPVWIFVADTGLGRLLKCEIAPLGRCHVEETGRIVSDRPERRPRQPVPQARRTGKGLTAHEEEEHVHRFARQTGVWLKRMFRDHRMEQLVLFAPPRFLGALRKTRSINGHSPIVQRRADLAHLDQTAIAKHPAIHALMGITH